MSKIDVNLYFLEIQNEYFEMLDNLKEFKELASEGKVSQEEYDQMLRQVDLVRSNYERIAYIIMLLNKPRKKEKAEYDIYKKWYNELQGASKQAVLDENADVLHDLKEFIKRGKENG